MTLFFLLISPTAEAAFSTFVTDAKANCVNAGVNFIGARGSPRVNLTLGQAFTIYTDPASIWTAANVNIDPLWIVNANGRAGIESTYLGLTTQVASLVGIINGVAGPVGAGNVSLTAWATGELTLVLWDCSGGCCLDNGGSMTSYLSFPMTNSLFSTNAVTNCYNSESASGNARGTPPIYLSAGQPFTIYTNPIQIWYASGDLVSYANADGAITDSFTFAGLTARGASLIGVISSVPRFIGAGSVSLTAWATGELTLVFWDCGGGCCGDNSGSMRSYLSFSLPPPTFNQPVTGATFVTVSSAGIGTISGSTKIARTASESTVFISYTSSRLKVPRISNYDSTALGVVTGQRVTIASFTLFATYGVAQLVDVAPTNASPSGATAVTLVFRPSIGASFSPWATMGFSACEWTRWASSSAVLAKSARTSVDGISVAVAASVSKIVLPTSGVVRIDSLRTVVSVAGPGNSPSTGSVLVNLVCGTLSTSANYVIGSTSVEKREWISWTSAALKAASGWGGGRPVGMTSGFRTGTASRILSYGVAQLTAVAPTNAAPSGALTVTIISGACVSPMDVTSAGSIGATGSVASNWVSVTSLRVKIQKSNPSAPGQSVVMSLSKIVSSISRAFTHDAPPALSSYQCQPQCGIGYLCLPVNASSNQCVTLHLSISSSCGKWDCTLTNLTSNSCTRWGFGADVLTCSAATVTSYSIPSGFFGAQTRYLSAGFNASSTTYSLISKEALSSAIRINQRTDILASSSGLVSVNVETGEVTKTIGGSLFVGHVNTVLFDSASDRYFVGGVPNHGVFTGLAWYRSGVWTEPSLSGEGSINAFAFDSSKQTLFIGGNFTSATGVIAGLTAYSFLSDAPTGLVLGPTIESGIVTGLVLSAVSSGGPTVLNVVGSSICITIASRRMCGAGLFSWRAGVWSSSSSILGGSAASLVAVGSLFFVYGNLTVDGVSAPAAFVTVNGVTPLLLDPGQVIRSACMQ